MSTRESTRNLSAHEPSPHRCAEILRVETARDFDLEITEAVCAHGWRWVTERTGEWTPREPRREGHHKAPRSCTLCGEALTGDEPRAGTRGGARLHDHCRITHWRMIQADQRDGIREPQCGYCRSRLRDAEQTYCDARCRDAAVRERRAQGAPR